MKQLFLCLGNLIKAIVEGKGTPDNRPLQLWELTYAELCIFESELRKNAELTTSFEKLREKYDFVMYTLFFQGWNIWGSKKYEIVARTFSRLLNELIILDEKIGSGRYETV